MQRRRRAGDLPSSGLAARRYRVHQRRWRAALAKEYERLVQERLGRRKTVLFWRTAGPLLVSRCCASKQEHCCIYDEKPIKALFISTLVVVIILGLFLVLQCWRWSRPEPSPLRASSPPEEPEPIAQAEVVPYPNR